LGPGGIGTSGDLLDFDFFGGSSKQESAKPQKQPEAAFDFGFGANPSSSTGQPAASSGPKPQDKPMDLMDMLGGGGPAAVASNFAAQAQSNPRATGKKAPDFSKDTFQTSDPSKYDMVNEMLNNFGSAATAQVGSGMNQQQ